MAQFEAELGLKQTLPVKVIFYSFGEADDRTSNKNCLTDSAAFDREHVGLQRRVCELQDGNAQ